MRRLSHPLLWLGVSLFAGYMALVLIRPQGVFWSLDEGGKLIYIQNVLAQNSATAPLDYPGRALDPQMDYLPLFFAARQGDQIYSWWPVGFPLLTLPLYQWFGWAGLYILPALAGAASSVLAALIAGSLAPQPLAGGERRRATLLLLTAAVTGVATPMLFYATMFWEHTLSVALLLLGVWLGVRAGQEGCKWCALGAGVAVSLAGFLRTEQLFAGLGILGVLAFWRLRGSVYMGVTLAATTVLWMAFNYATMGSWLSRQWGEGAANLTNTLFPAVAEAGWLYAPYLLFNSPKIIAYDLGVPLLTGGALLVFACLLLPSFDRLLPLLISAYAALAAICGYVLLQPEGYRSVHGVVLIAPHIVCFVWVYRGLRGHEWQDWRRWRQWVNWPLALVSATALFLFAAFVARSWLAAGGQQWGTRYLLLLYPLLTAAAAAGLFPVLQRPAYRGGRGLTIALALLVLVGAGFQVRGQQAVWSTVQNYRLTQQAMQQVDHTPKLTDCIWLPMVIPELYWRGDIFARHGEHYIPAAWLESIRNAGAVDGEWMEADMCQPVPLDQIARQREDNPTGIWIGELPE